MLRSSTDFSGRESCISRGARWRSDEQPILVRLVLHWGYLKTNIQQGESEASTSTDSPAISARSIKGIHIPLASGRIRTNPHETHPANPSEQYGKRWARHTCGC